MARIVVTGGSGFVGSHICDALIARGDAVVCIDNLLTGQRENVAHLIGHERFTFIEADVIESIPVSGAVDLVMHLASPASPPEYLRLPFETLDVSSIGTRRGRERAARRRGSGPSSRNRDSEWCEPTKNRPAGSPLPALAEMLLPVAFGFHP